MSACQVKNEETAKILMLLNSQFVNISTKN